jgi:hypothetical protein
MSPDVSPWPDLWMVSLFLSSVLATFGLIWLSSRLKEDRS